MSEVKVNKISPRSGTNVQLGDSGDTITVPSGATLDASNATTTLPANVVTTTGTQTLTNKTIGSSQLTGALPALDGSALTGIPDTIAPTRHSIRPSLNLDFANSKALDPRITFTRASNATYYDGYTSVKAEENIILGSNDFENYWSQGGVTLSQNATAPDGTTTAFTFTETATTEDHQLGSQNIHGASGKTYIFSAYFKKGSGSNAPDFIQFAHGGTTSSASEFNLSTGTPSSSGYSNRTMEDVGNGWYRCSHTVSPGTGTLSFRINFCNNTQGSGRNPVYLGDTNSDVLLWGVQVEERDNVTTPLTYTATTNTPVTNFQPALQTAGNNVPRFDHNPITGESKGLLAEQGETNLSTYSEDVVNWYSTKAYSDLKSNVAIAPDGTLTADRVIKDNATANSYVGKSFSLTNGSSYTASVYVKKYQSSSSLNYFAITNESNSGNTAWFNLDTATVGTVRGTNASATITDVGNGWYRISYSWTQTSGGTKVIYHRISDGDDTTSSTGNDFDGYFVWGFQLEAGAERMLTSYIKTEGSTVTRDRDEAFIDNIDTSDWLKQGKGTVYVETNYYDVNFSVTNLHFATLYHDKSGARFYVRYTQADRVAFLLTDGINNQTSTVSGANNSTLPNVNHKVAYSYAPNNINFAVNGGTLTGDTTAKVGEFNIFYLTRTSSTSQRYNGHLKKIAYYPTNLTSNEIVDLTEE